MQVQFLEDIKIEVPLAHCPEWYQEEGQWREEGYNYRLNTCDTILLLVDNNQVVGHMGISEDTIRSVSIDEVYQGQGLSYKLYSFAFNFFDKLYSDDAREPVANTIWRNLKKQYSNQITFDKEKNQFVFEK